MAKSSWRFEFVDVNKSIDVTEESTQWIGYAVVRSPKGETEAKYIPPANQARIEAMYGYASADYPDLYELIDFNRNYGVYVSAPSADTSKHPNYYGGIYLTSKGIQEFYRVTNKKSPNFEVGIIPSKESTYKLGTDKNSTIDARLDDPELVEDQSYIDFNNIPAVIYNKCNYLDFNNWKTGETFRYKLNKASGTVVDEKNNTVCGTIFPSESNKIGNINPKAGCYDIRLGGTSGEALQVINDTTGEVEEFDNWNTSTGKSPFIKLSQIKDVKGKSASYAGLIGDNETFEEWSNSENEESEGNALKQAIIAGTEYKNEDKNYVKTFKPLCESFRLVYDIKDAIYAHISQVSPTAYKSHITIDSITYDKYIYDAKLKYTCVDSVDDLPKPNTKEYNNLEGNPVLWFPKGLSDVGSNAGVYRYNVDITTDDDGVDRVIGWEKDESYETKRILAFEPLFSGDKDEEKEHSIFFIEDNFVQEMTLDAIDADYKLKENPLYNSFHSTCYEYDMEDELHSSYDFTGSLDEFGVDENGSDNYWGELLPPGEAVTFAEVYVDRTFDEELDKKGVYTGTRIEKTVEDPEDREVSGQRYIDYLVETNIANGYTGGDVTNETSEVTKAYAKCIKLGLEAAASPKYEDAIIFMEFTGIDSVKTYFNAIRTNHKMATIISPKNITENIFNNISKIRVVNPLRGSAQYCQELQYKDKNLRKTYYSCPIGAMAAMLMRIIERKYGGAAPMWINDAGMGGQIEEFMTRTPIKARWDFEDEDTKILDQKQINPIIFDVDDGIMAVSHRTTEMYSGDWGYLGHSMAFDLCKREIRDNVMKHQIGKVINDYWIDKRQEQTDKILGYRISGNDKIWSYAKAEVRNVNNEYTKAQRIFNIAVDVRVNPFSEKVRLTFTNLSQITTTSE